MHSLRPFLLSAIFFCFAYTQLSAQSIPLPEHPRPDFERADWQNLNGTWQFEFDAENEGVEKNWHTGNQSFSKTILVPFPWGSELSGVEDEADIGWYQREINVDESWEGQRIFLTIGASDWETTVWLDGELLGKHQGGYVPFSFELTDLVNFGETQKLVVRADDIRRDFTLYGKQGYGNARGIWQTVYLEARGQNYLDAVHFTPDIDNEKVTVTAYLPEDASEDLPVQVNITNANLSAEAVFPKGAHKVAFDIAIPDARLWTLDDPFLYEAEATLGDDKVNTYFGMRKISVMDMPGTDYPYIALNDEPIYVQLALDQSYHPEGFYTFPSDQFMKKEIERSKSIGLNGIRIHIKVEVPRKLYWADRLGLLVMADLPNSWGEPDEKMQAESEYTLREMIKRDFNHPSIFSWIIFNETWGLRTEVMEDGQKRNRYLPKTQQWVASMYYLTKSLDMSRLVEDNSICCGVGHTETDINSWHSYLPGWAWDEHLREISERTYPGSRHHFEDGFEQEGQPNINSEFGNVWGYDGSTGDVDWSWDYHRAMNSFRMYPKISGWLYTEHHDVINEWNGYWRFDRSEKETGVGELVEGMTVNDFHAPIYLSTGNEISRTVKGGEEVRVPLFLSAMTGEELGEELTLSYELAFTNAIGETETLMTDTRKIDYQPWMQKKLSSLSLQLPTTSGLAILKLKLADAEGNPIHHNFMFFEVQGEQMISGTEVLSVAPHDFSKADWSLKQWDVREGRKVNGAGKGYFEYTIELPDNFNANGVEEAYFLAELSAKQLFEKDKDQEFQKEQDYMKGDRVYPSSNPNSYPMTDETDFPSEISISINGKKAATTTLKDDPADHRGVLSWHHQLQDRKLREAGSYGYLVKVPVSETVLRQAAADGQLTVRIETTGEGGVAVYGKEFGRYPFDPSLVVKR